MTTIRLQTSKGREVPNIQGFEVSAYERNWNTEELPRLHPDARIGDRMSATYNCHGFTFASRRTRIPDAASVHMILADDAWERVAQLVDVRAGDIIVYADNDGDLTHSGFVLDPAVLDQNPWVLSKWGNGPEIMHRYLDVPDIYGKDCRFYRCRL